MDRNLMHLNTLLFSPFLSCTKKTGPFDSIFINKPTNGIIQLKTNTVTNPEKTISKALLATLLEALSNGISLTFMTKNSPYLEKDRFFSICQLSLGITLTLI